MKPEIDEPKVRHVYEVESRNETYQVVYVDEQVVLLRREGASNEERMAHRIERREAFEEQIESGFVEHRPDSDLDLIDEEEEDWAEVDYIGEKTDSRLHQNGYDTNIDIQCASDDELLEVSGLGDRGLANLREFIR